MNEPPETRPFCFSRKRKTSGRDSLSIRVQVVKCNMQRLVLESHPFCFYGFHAMKLLKFTLYVCMHAVYVGNPESLKGPLTSVQGQRALPFNNTCCSSERLCLMRPNLSFSAASAEDKQTNFNISQRIINKMTIYRPNYDISVFAAPKMYSITYNNHMPTKR